MSGNGPRRLPSPVRPLLSLLGFDSEAERGAFVSELRRKVVPRSLSLATLGAASVMVTEMAHPGTIPLLLRRPSCLGDWQDDSHMSLYGVGWVLQFLGAVALVAFYEREMTREACREPRAAPPGVGATHRGGGHEGMSLPCPSSSTSGASAGMSYE